MTRVTKEKNKVMNDVINVETNTGNFYISFERDFNLYFSYLPNNANSDDCKFYIGKDNMFLYKCFDELYDSVMSEKPFKYSKNLAHPEYTYALSKCKTELVHDGIIDIHSEDDHDYDLASTLSISKDEDFYVLDFKKSKSLTSYNAYSVCIKNASSGYDPYNAAFMIMYNNLRNHDFELDNCDVLDKPNVKLRKR